MHVSNLKVYLFICVPRKDSRNVLAGTTVINTVECWLTSAEEILSAVVHAKGNIVW